MVFMNPLWRKAACDAKPQKQSPRRPIARQGRAFPARVPSKRDRKKLAPPQITSGTPPMSTNLPTPRQVSLTVDATDTDCDQTDLQCRR
jgi:hypothetical protein